MTDGFKTDPQVAEGEDMPTPRGGSPIPVASISTMPSYSHYIQGTPGEEEVLDSRKFILTPSDIRHLLMTSQDIE